MTNPTKKRAIEEEWKRVNETINSLLLQFTPDEFVKGDAKEKPDKFFVQKTYKKELNAFIEYEFKRAKKEEVGDADPESFHNAMEKNFNHYRYERKTKNSIAKLKAFLNFLTNKKGNMIAGQQLWPEEANPILSPIVVKMIRKYSEKFDKEKEKERKLKSRF